MPIERLQLLLEIEQQVVAVLDGGQTKPLTHQLADQRNFKLGFALGGHTNIFWSKPRLNSWALSI